MFAAVGWCTTPEVRLGRIPCFLQGPRVAAGLFSSLSISTFYVFVCVRACVRANMHACDQRTEDLGSCFQCLTCIVGARCLSYVWILFTHRHTHMHARILIKREREKTEGISQ